MLQTHDFDMAVERMLSAVTDGAGDLRPIDRIEFEVLDGGKLRWNLWENGRRIFTAGGRAGDVAGFLAATKIMLEIRSEQETDHAQTSQ